MKYGRTLALAGLLSLGASMFGATDVFAQGAVSQCADLPNPIYMQGTTAVLPVVRHLSAKLQQLGYTLLFYGNEGCAGVQQLVWPVNNKIRVVYSYYTEADPSSLNGKVFPTTCNGGVDPVPNIAINDLSWTSCPASRGNFATVGTLPPNYKEFLGPVQGLVPIVANSFYYSDITADELLVAYMCGAQGNILGLTNNATIYGYNCTGSGMRELFAKGLGLANADSFSHISLGDVCNGDNAAENMVIGAVAPTTSPDTTIGYTSTEFYDAYRGTIRGLKVRGLNQKLAYLPDSDVTATDKINLREGRYTLQGSLKLTAQVDPATGLPVNPGAKKVIDWMQDNPVLDGALKLPVEINAIYALNGVVPQCAMRVTKDSDQLGFRHYRDSMPCHCSFEMLATGKTSIPGCTPCADVSTCASGQVCSHGYCE